MLAFAYLIETYGCFQAEWADMNLDFGGGLFVEFTDLIMLD